MGTSLFQPPRNIQIKNDDISKAIESFGLLTEAMGEGLITNEQYEAAEQKVDMLLEKADKTKLIKKKVWVTRGNKTFQQTVYVNPETDKEELTPLSGELAPEVGGMNIEKYSEKAMLITGDTYVNKDLLRDIKKEINVGSWNRKLNGWVFPLKFQDTILGMLWSKLVDAGEDDKAQAVQNQKNASFKEGDTATFNNNSVTVLEEISNSDGIKYKVRLENGSEMRIDERLLSKEAMTDDKEIAEKISEAVPANRAKTQKQIFGFKPIEGIHNYSLAEYAEMHGITQQELDAYMKKQPKDGKSGGKKSSPSVTRDPNKKSEGLTKNQIIAKLAAKHRGAVEKALSDKLDVPDEVLKDYPDLAKKKKTLTEEHKRKIAEALRKDNPEIEQEQALVDEQSDIKVDRENYKPLDGQRFIIQPRESEYNGKAAIINSKDYTNVPAIDVVIPKPNKILDAEKPYFIPDINKDIFKRNAYTLPSLKLGEDRYLVALDGFANRRGSILSTRDINTTGKFAIMSLDSMTATENYYQLQAKALFKKEQDEYVKKRRKDIVDFQIKQGKTLEEATEIANSRKIKTKRLSVLSKSRMTYDQMDMITALNRDRGISRSDAWGIYGELQKEKNQKASDIALHQEYIDSSYSKGQKTSYGDSGTKDDLLEEYGVKVKRQNGDVINDSEIAQIKNSLDSVASVFGKNAQMNKDFGLKISHSGDVLMHARKAVGLFHPTFSAIGVSSRDGDSDFKFTFGHEYAHFMDYWIGKTTGNHYASDKQGSTANKIAQVLRSNMNKKTDSKYYNRTCECFARALEQYHATESMGAGDAYFAQDTQVNKEVYNEQLKPLIQQFLNENKELLKGTIFGDFFGHSFNNDSKAEVKKSFLQGLRNIFSSPAHLVDGNNNRLSDVDISREVLRVSDNYVSSLHEDRENIIKSHQEEIDSINEIAKSNEAVNNLREARIEAIDSALLQDLLDNTQKIEKALEELKIANWGHLKNLEISNNEFAYKKYIDSSLGRSRDTMPQIDSENIDDVILHFSQKSPNAKVTKEVVLADKINFIQGEVDESKILSMMDGGVKKMTRFLLAKADRKYYLIDGHHRFCALCELEDNPSISAYVIHLSPKETVRRLNLMKISSNDSISKSERDFAASRLEKSDKKEYAASILYNDKGEILFLRRHPSDGFHPNTLCLPSGGIEGVEMPIEAAKRELFEETSIESNDLIPQSTIETDTSIIYYFHALADNYQIVLDKEHSNYEWISLDKLRNDESKRSELIMDLYYHLEEMLNPFYELMKDEEKTYKSIKKSLRDDIRKSVSFDPISYKDMIGKKVNLSNIFETNKNSSVRASKVYGFLMNKYDEYLKINKDLA